MIARAFPYFLAALLVASSTTAEENNETVRKQIQAVTVLKNAVLGLKSEDREKAVRNALLDIALNNADVANDLLLQNITGYSSPLGRLVENLNLRLNALEGGNEEEGTTLAVNYDYQKAVRKVFENDANRFTGLKGSFAARGNIAFQSIKNPRDFLDTTLNLGYFSSWGGVVDIADNAFYDKANDIEDNLTEIKELYTLLRNDEWQDFKDLVGSHLSNQYYLGVGLDAGFESDQRFETKHLTFGLDLDLVPRGWGQDSFLGKINVLDYVPALIRMLSGQDSQWSPRGSGFPTLNTALKRVLPQDDDPRAEAGDESDFWRYEIEIGFSSLLGRWKDRNVTWESNVRYYSEINPDKSIKRAGLNDYTYFVTAVTIANGMFISYSTGKLPFDTKNDQVYELGFSYQF